MKIYKVTVIFLLLTISAFAQKPNAEINKMLKEVSAKNIENSIRKLVSFGTRNTLSEQNNPTRGIGAARDWIFAEMQKISNDCGGCLTVEKQSFEQPKATRIPQPTILTNVVATLKGTTDPTRIYVVSGHYDSMCSSPIDAVCDAPGANDDASGSAAVIEMARVMSKYKFDATIIFMTVAGEDTVLTFSIISTILSLVSFGLSDHYSFQHITVLCLILSTGILQTIFLGIAILKKVTFVYSVHAHIV